MLKPVGRAVISAMHPAMFLRGSQARFTDPATGELVLPGSVRHSLGEFVMAAIRAGFQIIGGCRRRVRTRNLPLAIRGRRNTSIGRCSW